MRVARPNPTQVVDSNPSQMRVVDSNPSQMRADSNPTQRPRPGSNRIAGQRPNLAQETRGQIRTASRVQWAETQVRTVRSQPTAW